MRVVVYLLAAILLFQTAITAMMLLPGSFFLWFSLGVILVVDIYLIVISLMLIKKLDSYNQNRPKL